MTFLEPRFLWLAVAWLLLAAVLLALFSRAHGRRLRLWLGEAPGGAKTGLFPQLFDLGMLALAIALVLVALARPAGRPKTGAGERLGVNLALVLDASKSMLAEDAFPNRLERAKRVAQGVLAKSPGSRVSLLVFSGETVVMAPPTFDLVSAQVIVRSVGTELAGRGGTALSGALDRARDVFKRLPADQPKAVLVLSDGECNEGDPVLAALRLKNDTFATVHAVSFGTETGARIPVFVRDESRALKRVGFQLDGSGAEVVTRSRPALLEALASATGGRAWRAQAGGEPDGLVSEIVAVLGASAQPLRDGAARVERDELYWLPLGGAVLLLLIETWRHARFRSGEGSGR